MRSTTGTLARVGRPRFNTTADAHDDNPADGTCAAASGKCALRAAVEQANASSGPDTVLVPAGDYQLTEPPSPTLRVTDDLTVRATDPRGARATTVETPDSNEVKGSVFENVEASLSVAGLTIAGGESGGDGFVGGGGGIDGGGPLTVDRSTIRGNTANLAAASPPSTP